MKLIDRYLLRTLLAPLFYCLFAFSLIYIVYDLFDNLSDFIKAGTPFLQVVRFYVYLIPSVLILIAPISILLAVLYSLSQLTKHNEMTAMRASGVSLYRLLLPFVGVGLAASIVVSYVNERVGPRAALWCYQFIQAERHKDRIDVNVVYNHTYKNELGRRIWLVESFNRVTFEMKGVKVDQEREDGSYETSYEAESAEWLDGRWWFHDVTIQEYDEDSNLRGRGARVAHREMIEFDEEPIVFVKGIKYDPEFMSAAELRGFVDSHPNLSEETVARYQVDFHYRLAMPWTCLVVALLGIPFGTETGRKGALMGVTLSISMFFALYVAINFGMALGKNGMIPPWVAGWGPNIMFLTIGCVLVYRLR
jgi:lipopolysaccharide export system permease protein